MTKLQSLRGCVAFLVAALAPSLAYANAGVFKGSGHTIKLIRSEDIQLRSEDVMIVPGRGPFLFDGTVPGMDRVQYRCKFVLQSRSNKPVTVQVGFPLGVKGLGPAKRLTADEETGMVLDYKFIARDKEQTYHVRFVPNDQDSGMGSVFLWDMTFRGGETRELNVSYEIPMTMGRGNTGGAEYAKKWYSRLESTIVESFSYVTVTGKSWAGPIEHAKFSLYVHGFERYLAERGIVEGTEAKADKTEGTGTKADESGVRNKTPDEDPFAEPDRGSPQEDSSPLDARVKNRLVHRQISPDGWKESDGVITWEFKNYRPKDPISVIYALTFLPKTPAAVPPFVKAIVGDKPSQDDLSDLREIYLAWWGIAPKSKSVRQFVSNQYWYVPKDGMTADKLTAEQKAVVAALERCSAKAEDDKKR